MQNIIKHKARMIHTLSIATVETNYGQDGQDLDDFGLPKKPARRVPPEEDDSDEEAFHDAEDGVREKTVTHSSPSVAPTAGGKDADRESAADEASKIEQNKSMPAEAPSLSDRQAEAQDHEKSLQLPEDISTRHSPVTIPDPEETSASEARPPTPQQPIAQVDTNNSDTVGSSPVVNKDGSLGRTSRRVDGPAVSEWSHQMLAPQQEKAAEAEEEIDWQAMPAVAHYDLYNDDGKLVARAAESEDEEEVAYGGLGGAGKGYTRVQLDEDAKSTTSMDEDTSYLFKETQKSNALEEEDEQRDAGSQLQATKDLLTEGQRIAYVGVTRLTLFNMVKELEDIETTRGTRKEMARALESTTKWGQQMMVRLYAHMEIDSAEQLMIEQLAEHGVQPGDLVPPLMQNSRVSNPMADKDSPRKTGINGTESRQLSSTNLKAEPEAIPLENGDSDVVPRVHTPSQMETSSKIDLDLRWTVLCDLFLLLIGNSVYDSRSRRLLEQVADAMDISWTQICRFEKRVIDALEMQEEAAQETWNEDDHMETRRKLGLKRKYMVMGIATVGGGLVIGLSAGLLAPVIGAGLAAGFTTIGVTGTAGFLGGVGGAALITSAATAAGGTIAVRASHRRTGAVKTFEYRPLHNNKRLNLILTVSGWMNGKVDDVRLPYSTVDPIMGDIYSLLWEPEMLQSMGDTINILATEALTQTVQQVLGSTILVALMASLQLPIVLTKLTYLIDNPWTVSLDRANSAGLILADSLIDRHLGKRPITLLGFSLGSRLIFSCLKELAARGAHGIVQNVYLFGSPIVAKKDEYLRARSVISGRFVNGYSSNDWILGYLFRATSGGIMRVAGLAPVEGVPGLENLDVTQLVNGHMAYRTSMPRLLMEVGWEVESEVFTEIDDPDPEDHQKRQRELIREIDDARKAAEAKPEKKRFGFFKRGALAEKKGWETYEADNASADGRKSTDSDRGLSNSVLFDIDAIRKELESEMIEVKQLESTMPPMRLDPHGPIVEPKPHSNLRPSRSSDASMATEIRGEPPASEALSSRRRSTEIPHMNLPPKPSEIADDHPGMNGEHDTMQQENEKISLSFDTYYPEPSATPPPPNRPELTTSKTMPTFASPDIGSLNLEHNAWADDEDFGQEREMKMTFE